MNKTSVSAFLGAALWIAAGSVHAQGSTTTPDSTATGPDRPATSTASPRTKRHASKSAAKRHDTARPDNEAGVSTPNSTGATSGAFTQSGSAVSTTPDVRQIKNARDGSPMRSSRSPASSPGR
jgi:hypothetical protein